MPGPQIAGFCASQVTVGIVPVAEPKSTAKAFASSTSTSKMSSLQPSVNIMTAMAARTALEGRVVAASSIFINYLQG